MSEFIETHNANPHTVFRAAMMGALPATFSKHIYLSYDPSLFMFSVNHQNIDIPEHSFYIKVHSYNLKTGKYVMGVTGSEDDVRYYEFRYRTGTGKPFAIKRERLITPRWMGERMYEKYLQKQVMKMYCTYLLDKPNYTHLVSGNEKLIHRFIKDAANSSKQDYLFRCNIQI